MKKCKFCQSDIDDKAKVCPICKRNLKMGKGCLILVILVALFTIGLGVTFVETINEPRESVKTEDNKYITLEKYNSVKMGMKYDDVIILLGINGEITSESSHGGYHIKIITWYGNSLGSNAIITFTNNKVSGKAQYGLK